MPSGRTAAPTYGPHPTSRTGAPVPGAPPPPPPGHRRPPRPAQSRQRPIRDQEAERERRFLQQQASARAAQTAPRAAHTEITASEGTTVKELAEKLGIKASTLIKTLVDRGTFATINQTLDMGTIKELAKYFGASAAETTYEEETMLDVDLAEAPGDSQSRAPVVTVMGHVDHGKTSLLDAIRETNVADREAGGITQAIGAYEVEKNGRRIVFVDTPGHEAFTRMRAQGAKVTDVVILVVAADDGVMPQTLEAIDHARDAKVPIIVAINKIDKPGGDPERVKQQLSERGLLPEEWGGDTVMVPVSAKAKQNLDHLLEMILLVADLKELTANPSRPAVGTVLEAKLDRGQGPVATVIVQNGTLRIGDYFVVGSVFSKVRALINDRGQQIQEAPPSSAVLVLGLDALPVPGDSLQVVTDTERARKIVEHREQKARELSLAKNSRLSLEQFQEQLRSGEVKELPILLKADVQGSVDVLTDTLSKLATEKVKVRVIRAGVGAISESDVLLAATANSVIVGFNVRPERTAAQLAEREHIDIRLHTVIYELVDELKKAMVGLLEPILKENFQGRADVMEAFNITKVGTIAGCIVQEGKATRDSEARLLRDNVVVYTGRVSSLRRFKDTVNEVRAGQECGIGLLNFNDVKQGDVIELFVIEKVAPELVI
jgi:translation initiation factor IF-2